jgi:PKD repeat protein
MASRKHRTNKSIVRAPAAPRSDRAEKKLENLETRKMFSRALLDGGILWVYGEDSVRSGNGRDSVNTGAGHDYVDGGLGNDTVRAGTGIDRVEAQSGEDLVFGEGGDDVLDAGVGIDTVHGGDGADTLIGEKRDSLLGEGGGEDEVKLVEYPTVTEPVANELSFSLINALSGKVIPGFESIKNNATIDLAALPTRKLNLRANAPVGKTAASVAFMLDGKRVRLENAAPFAFAGDVNGKYTSWTPKVGLNRIAANAFAGRGGTGAAGKTVALSLNVIDSSAGKSNSGGGGSVNQPNKGNNNSGGPSNNNDNDNDNPAAPVASIDAMSTSIEFGHAVHVHALDSRLKNGTSLAATYEWNFGDAGSDYNVLRGFNAAHVYSRPGTYTVTLRVTDSAGNVDVATRNVTVRESSRRVIYVSNDGSDRNNGRSNDAPVKTWDRARELLDDNTEIRFRAGDTFNVDTAMLIGGNNVLLTSYGGGHRPVLRWNGDGGYNRIIEAKKGSRDVTVRGLEFDSRFGGTDQDNVPVALRPGGTNFAAIDCRIGNVSHFINSEMKPTGVLAQENVSPSTTALRGYLAYVVGSDHVYLGNTAANSTREHVIRSDGGVRVLVAYNDLSNVARSGDRYDIMKQTVTIHWGSDVYLLNNKTAGGRVEIGPLGEGDGLRPQNIGQRLYRVVVEGNRFQFAANQRVEIDHGTTGVVIRNNTIRTTDGAGVNIQAMGRYTSWPQYGDRNVRDVWITRDNDIQGTRWATIGRGASNINIDNGTSERRLSSGAAVRTIALPSAARSDGLVHLTDATLSSFRSLAA